MNFRMAAVQITCTMTIVAYYMTLNCRTHPMVKRSWGCSIGRSTSISVHTASAI